MGLSVCRRPSFRSSRGVEEASRGVESSRVESVDRSEKKEPVARCVVTTIARTSEHEHPKKSQEAFRRPLSLCGSQPALGSTCSVSLFIKRSRPPPGHRGHLIVIATYLSSIGRHLLRPTQPTQSLVACRPVLMCHRHNEEVRNDACKVRRHSRQIAQLNLFWTEMSEYLRETHAVEANVRAVPLSS